jgi:hypothetical protein
MVSEYTEEDANGFWRGRWGIAAGLMPNPAFLSIMERF